MRLQEECERWHRMWQDGKVSPDQITEDTIGSYLDTAGVPDPDLLIRTSGEQRLSNFLMWQLAYTEFYFTDVAWPDFHKAELVQAIEKYNQRDRRYGGVRRSKMLNTSFKRYYAGLQLRF